MCIVRCPVRALEDSDQLNQRGVYPPRLKEDNECNFCRLCELICPDFVITVTPDEGVREEKKLKLIIGGITHEV